MPDDPKVDKPAAAPELSAPVTGLKNGSQHAGGDAAKPVAPPVTEPTAEEQMERFAQDLKENDWGHQPC